MYTDMSYYTWLFGKLMTVTPVYYEYQNGEHFVHLYGDSILKQTEDGEDEAVIQLVRASVDMVSADKNRFNKKTLRSTQRLGIHFRNTLPYLPDNVKPITQIPEREVLEKVLGKE